MDRIDLALHLESTDTAEPITDPVTFFQNQCQITFLTRVLQWKRLSPLGKSSNVQMTITECDQTCEVSEKAKKLLQRAVETLALSKRRQTAQIRVAQTIAEIAFCTNACAQKPFSAVLQTILTEKQRIPIEEHHIAESLTYVYKERK
jgi:predicted ATPase with chaperone activity